MAKYLGRSWTCLAATTSPGTTSISNRFDADLSRDLEDTDSTTNDSNGSREHEITFDSGQLTFKVYADESDAGLTILRDAFKNKTKIYIRFRPRGNVSGARQLDFLCSVRLKEGGPINGLATFDVTLKRSGAETWSTQ